MTIPDEPVAISVIVPCYNSSRFIQETVASLLAQTRRDFEVIFVDDGSTDDTAGTLARLIDASAPTRRMTLAAQPNAGVAAARNRGIALARGRYILPLDADDRIAPAMLEICAGVLDGKPDTALVFPDRRDFGAREGVFNSGAFVLARLKYFNQLPYCAMFRRALWESVGGYRTNVSGFDDWDFWVAAAARGCRAHHVAEPLLQHRRHRDSQLPSAMRDYERLFARIILNNREVYEPHEITAAERFLIAGEQASLLRLGKAIFAQRYPWIAGAPES